MASHLHTLTAAVSAVGTQQTCEACPQSMLCLQLSQGLMINMSSDAHVGLLLCPAKQCQTCTVIRHCLTKYLLQDHALWVKVLKMKSRALWKQHPLTMGVLQHAVPTSAIYYTLLTYYAMYCSWPPPACQQHSLAVLPQKNYKCMSRLIMCRQARA